MLCSCEDCSIKNYFFNTLKPHEISKFCDNKREIIIPKGHTFITQGDNIKGFKYLKHGLIKLHRIDTNGKEQIISFGKPKDFVSIHNIFAEKNYSFKVTALEESVICHFDLDLIDSLVNENGQFAFNIIKTTTQASNKIISDSLDLLSCSMYGKIAKVILFFYENVYKTYGFELPISRKEIAQYTGLSIETVIRVISEFRKDGIIKVYGKRIEIIDKKALEEIYKHSK